MTEVICDLEECIYCVDGRCTRAQIYLSYNHSCDGGCDDGWVIERGEEEGDWKWMI